MDSKEELLFGIDNLIDEKQNMIREQFFHLGERMYKSKANIGVGKKLFEECIAYETRKSEAEEKYKALVSLYEEYEEKRKSAEEEKVNLDNLFADERELKIRLGAIIYERSSLSLLDRDSFPYAYSDVDKDIELHKKLESRNPIERLSAQNNIQKFQKNINDYYISYADKAIDADNLELIGGNNAPMVIEELQALLSKKSDIEKRIEDLEFFLEVNRQEVNRLRKGGLEEAENYKNDIQNSYHESLISYGNYLFDRGGVWIGEDTSSDVLDIIEEILKLQNEYSRLNEEKQTLQKQAKVNDYRLLIENERAKISILEREKEKIDEEIAQIENEINKLNSLIEKL